MTLGFWGDTEGFTQPPGWIRAPAWVTPRTSGPDWVFHWDQQEVATSRSSCQTAKHPQRGSHSARLLPPENIAAADSTFLAGTLFSLFLVPSQDHFPRLWQMDPVPSHRGIDYSGQARPWPSPSTQRQSRCHPRATHTTPACCKGYDHRSCHPQPPDTQPTHCSRLGRCWQESGSTLLPLGSQAPNFHSPGVLRWTSLASCRATAPLPQLTLPTNQDHVNHHVQVVEPLVHAALQPPPPPRGPDSPRLPSSSPITSLDNQRSCLPPSHARPPPCRPTLAV